jgi:hypothetical protein
MIRPERAAVAHDHVGMPAPALEHDSGNVRLRVPGGVEHQWDDAETLCSSLDETVESHAGGRFRQLEKTSLD